MGKCTAELVLPASDALPHFHLLAPTRPRAQVTISDGASQQRFTRQVPSSGFNQDLAIARAPALALVAAVHTYDVLLFRASMKVTAVETRLGNTMLPQLQFPSASHQRQRNDGSESMLPSYSPQLQCPPCLLAPSSESPSPCCVPSKQLHSLILLHIFVSLP